MKELMNQETVKIILAVIFVAVMLVYINVRGEAALPEVNDEVVMEIADTLENGTEDSTAPPVTTEPEPVAEPEVVETPSFLDSFDEDALIGEYDDVQTGIDLLNNPLQ